MKNGQKVFLDETFDFVSKRKKPKNEKWDTLIFAIKTQTHWILR